MTKLFVLSFSHPSLAARLMLEHAGVEHGVVALPPGLHPVLLRARGFRGGTVPAMRIDGRRVQGSLEISRELDRLGPARPLFPSDPAARRRVEEAERWGEAELQPVPRRAFRWALARDPDLRRRLAAWSRLPAPAVAGRLMRPIARLFAAKSRADDATVRADLAWLPEALARVEGWIADGTLGGAEPNAADFQIGTTVGALLAFDDLRDRIGHRPAAEHARRLVPDYPGRLPAGLLPPEWLRPLE